MKLRILLAGVLFAIVTSSYAQTIDQQIADIHKEIDKVNKDKKEACRPVPGKKLASYGVVGNVPTLTVVANNPKECDRLEAKLNKLLLKRHELYAKKYPVRLFKK